MARTGLVFLLLLPLLTNISLAQDSSRVINAHRITERIKIDGVLDDPAWSDIQNFEGKFYQISPNNGAESAYETKIQIAYDNRAIYIGAQLYDPDPETIPQELGDRDDGNLNVDAFGVFIDTYKKGQNGFGYMVTAAGVQGDLVLSVNDEDDSWNAVWDSEVAINDKGWAVEMEIPYSAIRFPNSENQVWGINFYRSAKRLNEESTFNFYNAEIEGFLNQFGELHGLKDIKPPLRLSFLPYFSVGGQYDNSTQSFSSTYAGGMDMKLGVSEGFTLDLSLIPDFSQVQSDNVILNLSPFEIRYDERRPFFTEGMELFSKGRIFYSRRVGQIRGYVDEGDLAPTEEITEYPLSAQLINATKLSGRTAAGTGIGFFNAITSNAYATITDTTETGGDRQYLVDPLANFNVTVIDQNLKNNSYVGIINTNVMRAGHYRDANVTLGDFRFRDKTNTYSVSGNFGTSQIFTREEEENLRTAGYSGRLSLSKVSGKLQYSAVADFEDDKWNINDLGFMRRNNQVSYSAEVSYNIFKPFSIFNRMSARLEVEYEQLYNPNTYTGADIGGRMFAQFKNFYNIGLGFGLRPFDNYDYFEPREDGYFFKTSGNYHLFMFLGTDRRKKFNVGGHMGGWKRPEDNARGVFGSIGPEYRVNNRMSFDYNIRFDVTRDTKGYVTKLYDDFDNLTNIIFGHRNRNEVTNTLNVKYTFTNKMGLTFRMRHYWSWVEYDKFYDLGTDGLLTDSNYTGIEEGVPVHNTTFNAFNIDMVYSWQVAPGSFFSAVYKNQIYASSEYAQKSFMENINNTFDENGTNSLTLKLVYYIDIAYFRKKEI